MLNSLIFNTALRPYRPMLYRPEVLALSKKYSVTIQLDIGLSLVFRSHIGVARSFCYRGALITVVSFTGMGC